MKKLHLLISLAVLLLALGCKDSLTETDLPYPEEPYNPYSDIDYTIYETPPIEIDSSSFLGLHHYIFSEHCNQPACHDGTFEPDFRTVESAYNSLVLHPVTKNYDVDPLPYRVSPGDTDASMLWHRLTIHNPPNFERMPASGNPLPEDLIALIETWINDGARDVYGSDPMQTSVQPTSFGVAAFLPDFNDFRIDTARFGAIYYPFLAPSNENIEMWFLYLDVTPEGDTLLGNELTHNKIRFSKNPVDFSDAVEVQMNFDLLSPNLIPSVFSQPYPVAVPYFHSVTIKPSDLGFGPGDVVFMRTYVQDSDHPEPTEIPEDDSQLSIIAYFAFILQ